MAQAKNLTKRVAISKANTQMVAIVAAAAFLTIFCLFAAKTAWSLNRYQAKVTTAKEKAYQQLEDNVKAFNKLKQSYEDFDAANPNAIGANRTGSGDNEGPNAKIILDALPSTYDFPALTSSLEKILAAQNLKVASITGTDDQVNQQGNGASTNPKPVSMAFTFSISDANYTSVGQLINKLQQSIRPIQIDSITLSGGATNMTVTVNGHTYYQPAKSLNIKKEIVK
jgi:hypothetical protein